MKIFIYIVHFYYEVFHYLFLVKKMHILNNLNMIFQKLCLLHNLQELYNFEKNHYKILVLKYHLSNHKTILLCNLF